MTARARLAAVLAAAALGCGGYVEAGVPHGCGLTLSPEPALQEATKRAARRITTATGCEVSVASGGAPVKLVHDVRDASGDVAEACGGTMLSRATLAVRWLEVDRQCSPWEPVILHELIHAIAPESEHTTTGVFADGFDREGPWSLNAEVLTELCAHAECLWFAPESP